MKHNNVGSVEVICGSMFCGKTEELIRRLRRARIAKQEVQVFKPFIDNRYDHKKITSHSGLDVDAQPAESSEDILTLLDPSTTVVGIDEVQFFDDGIVDVVETLAEKGIRVIVTGLDMDFRGEPFGCMPDLMARAEKVEKLQAICMVCGESASRTQRLVNGTPAHYDEPIVVVGAQEMYEARCRKHHQVPRD
ncbi:MAG: thymidine kinase [Chloroflexota bacterium]|nr:thymidine kinase [Chloroflexota bacterium]